MIKFARVCITSLKACPVFLHVQEEYQCILIYRRLFIVALYKVSSENENKWNILGPGYGQVENIEMRGLTTR